MLARILSRCAGKVAMDTMSMDFQMGKMIAAPSANVRSRDMRIHSNTFSA